MSNREPSRRALAASLLFPWLLFPSPQPPEGAQVLVQTPPAATAEALIGVVVESVGGWTLEKAGVQAGDVLLHWKRLPAPPANLEPAEGVLTGYFDWVELVMEQAPRGTVVLTGRRGEEAKEFNVKPGLWDAKVRPVLSPKLEQIYERGKAQLGGGDVEGSVATWREVVNAVPEGDARDLESWMLWRMGEAWGNRGEWGKAVELAREGTPGSARAKVAMWLEIGRFAATGEQFGPALDSYSSALYLQSSLSAESLVEATILTRQGEVEWSRGSLALAGELFQKALAIRERYAQASTAVAESLNCLGLVAWLRGQLDIADGLYSRALELDRSLAPESLEVASVLNNLGRLARDQGNQSLARLRYQETIRIKERLAPGSETLAVGLGNLGDLERESGELEKARALYLKSLFINKEIKDKEGIARSLVRLGLLAHDQGAWDVAYDYYRQAMRLRKQMAFRNLDIASSLHNLGLVAHNLGDSNRAIDFYLNALKIETEIAPESLRVANTLNNLGGVAWTRGDLISATDYYLRALEIRKRLAPGSPRVATSLNNLGMVKRARGELDAARAYHREALRIMEKLAPRSLAWAALMNNLASVEEAENNWSAASDHYLMALKVKQQLAPGSLDLALTLGHLADVSRARGQLSLARTYYRTAFDAFQIQSAHLGASYDVNANFRTQHHNFYLEFLELLLTQRSYGEAFLAHERYRAQIFLAMITERDIAYSVDIPAELDRERRRLGFLYDRTLKTLGGLNPRDHAREIDRAREELRRLDDEAGDVEVEIRKASPRLAALRYPEPLDAERARQALDPGTLLLSWSIGKGKSTLFALCHNAALEVHTVPFGEEALRAKVQHLLSILPEARGDSAVAVLRRNQLTAASHELFDLLLAPAAERIAASERLLILPDGPLHALPFGVLIHRSDEGVQDQYLAAWKPLHVALSATVFAELKNRRRGPPEAGVGAVAPPLLAAFGDPVYPQHLAALKDAPLEAVPAAAVQESDRIDPTVRGAAERGLFDFQPLPYTRREVEGIASLFPAGTARTFLGAEALEDRVKTLDPKTRILHFAAHAGIDEHLPSGSFIALTVPEETPEVEGQPPHDNGLLQVWEIVERVRIDADLVVLSACESGLGKELGGEGLIGLTRAFQYAGARSVMASLWNVNDQATAELMIRFYRHLRAGKTKDEALRAAQRELIESPIEIVDEKGEKQLFDASAPYYWAAFQVYGDWQ